MLLDCAGEQIEVLGRLNRLSVAATFLLTSLCVIPVNQGKNQAVMLPFALPALGEKNYSS